MTFRADPRAASAGQRRPNVFGPLLALLVLTYVLSAFTKGDLVNSVQVVLFLGVVLLALRTGRLRRRAMRLMAIGLLAGTAVAVILQRTGGNAGAGVANIWTALILLLSAALIIGRVLSRPEITLQSIYGAVSAYMILGLMFAAVYTGMWHFAGLHFFAPNEAVTSNNTFQYFSFTTLTTLGYGDYTAAQAPGQAIAVIEAVVGQIFLATLVARLVAGFRGPAARPAATSQAGDSADAGVPGTGSSDGTSPRDGAGLVVGDGHQRGNGGAPDASGPADGRRARSRRAGAGGLVGLSPPGAVRRRLAAGLKPSSSPGRSSRARR